MNSNFGDAVTMKSTGSLANAAVEINGLFLQSKNILRTHVVSIYSGGEDANIDMDPVSKIREHILLFPNPARTESESCSCDYITDGPRYLTYFVAPLAPLSRDK